MFRKIYFFLLLKKINAISPKANNPISNNDKLFLLKFPIEFPVALKEMKNKAPIRLIIEAKANKFLSRLFPLLKEFILSLILSFDSFFQTLSKADL